MGLVARGAGRGGAEAEGTGGVAGDDVPGRHVVGDDGTGAYDGAFLNVDAGEDQSSYADKGLGSDDDGGGLERQMCLAETVGTRAKIGFLGDRGFFMKDDGTQRVGIGAIA